MHILWPLFVRKCRRIVESFRYYGRKRDESEFVSAVLRGDAAVRQSVLLAFDSMRNTKIFDWGELHEVQRETAEKAGCAQWPAEKPAKTAETSDLDTNAKTAEKTAKPAKKTMKRPAASMVNTMKFAKRRHVQRRHTV